MEIIKTYFQDLWYLSLEMAPYLLFGFLVAGTLSVYIPKSWIQKHLGGNTFSSVLKASIFGIPLPLCSCGVIPTSISLKENGASKGSTVSFLISTPQTGVDSILATYALIGLPFALIKLLIALITGIIGGQLVHALDPEKVTINQNHQGIHKNAPKGSIKTMLQYAFGSFVEDIAKWLVIGLLIAAAITSLVPDDFFQSYLNYSWMAIPVVLLISTPMYVCATGSVPIAAALLMKGMSPGAALVFLLAGPATNAATITVLWNKLGKKATLIYLSTIIFFSIFFGIMMDLFFRETFKFTTGELAIHHHGTMHWLSLISSIILWALMIRALVIRYIPKSKKKNTTDVGPFEGLQLAKTTEINVKGMTCNHCTNLIEEEVSNIPGITSVQASLQNNTVEIQGQNIDLEKAKSKINSLGYSC